MLCPTLWKHCMLPKVPNCKLYRNTVLSLLFSLQTASYLNNHHGSAFCFFLNLTHSNHSSVIYNSLNKNLQESSSNWDVNWMLTFLTRHGDSCLKSLEAEGGNIRLLCTHDINCRLSSFPATSTIQ